MFHVNLSEYYRIYFFYFLHCLCNLNRFAHFIFLIFHFHILSITEGHHFNIKKPPPTPGVAPSYYFLVILITTSKSRDYISPKPLSIAWLTVFIASSSSSPSQIRVISVPHLIPAAITFNTLFATIFFSPDTIVMSLLNFIAVWDKTPAGLKCKPDGLTTVKFLLIIIILSLSHFYTPDPGFSPDLMIKFYYI